MKKAVRMLGLAVALVLVAAGGGQAQKEKPRFKPVSEADILKMVKAGLEEDVIVAVIKKRGVNFPWDEAALARLKEGGAPPAVLAAVRKKVEEAEEAAIEAAVSKDSDATRKQGGQAAPPEPREAKTAREGDGPLARAEHEKGLVVEVLEVRPDRNEMLYIRWRYRNPTKNPVQLIAATPRFRGSESPPNTAEKFLAAVYYVEGKIETDQAFRHSVVRQAGTGLPFAKDLGRAAVVIRPGQQFEVWAKFALPHARTEKAITFHVMDTPLLEDVPIQAGKE
jgi:hypothetical protein